MIIPSIDLKNGKAVQLKQGKALMLEREDPMVLAEKFHSFGPLAVIDLDAAFGQGNNLNLIKELCHRFECRVGGGIRTCEQAVKLLACGASKIIIGSAVWHEGKINHEFLGHLRNETGKNRIILALDCLEENVVIKGWTENTGASIFDVIPEVSEYVSELLVTVVEREGCLQGTDLNFFERLGKISPLPVTAAGGITTADEITALSRLGMDVQLGMCLYTGKITLEEAFAASLNWEKGNHGLLPTVVMDRSGRVLMLAWSSAESLRESLKKKLGCYYSRSRKCLWTKGETSGNFQELIKVRTDCDGDTLLFVVRQIGDDACHKQRKSCFGDWPFSLAELQEIIRERLRNKTPDSYTASLDDDKVREKLLEEAEELASASGPEEIIWEAADLLYFLIVLLSREDIDLTRVLSELQRRRRSTRRAGAPASFNKYGDGEKEK